MSGSIIRIKRSAVPGKKPTTSDLATGELALNTFDAELYVKRVRAGIGTDIVKIGVGATVTNILYVTKDGKDTNTGKKLGDAKGTIKGAVAAATEGTVIKVSAGTYLEDNPIVLPNQVSVVGDSLREVSVIPLNQADLFHVGNGCYVAEMSYFPLNGESNPHAVFAFDPVNLRYIDQSPYIQNCTNFIPESVGLQVDGTKALGQLKSMVLDSYTQYNPNGVGASMTNEGYAQLVSLFTICDNIAVYCGSGGACDLTNSNASFGNYGLVADGVGPLKYKGLVTKQLQEGTDTFAVDLTTPTFKIINAYYDNVSGFLTAYTDFPHDFSVGMGVELYNMAFKCTDIPSSVNITNALYDNVSGIATIYTDIPHKLQVGFGVSVVGLGFTCPSGPGIVTYPSGNLGYNFEVLTVASGRYLDASNLILANKTEIQDKALAAIALDHPDFYFPNDPQTSNASRFYDSYRLIQKNKQEIIDKSLASIAIGFPSSFYFPDELETNSQSRYYDASRLIQINKQEIIDKSLASVAIAHSDFYFPGDTQTNSRSRYYDSYRLIQQNRQEIINSAWSATASAYPSVVSTEVTCKRDLGFFIDAVSTDVFTGGNNYSRQFTLQYFNNGVLISNGLLGELTESVFAFNQARDLMKQAITNQLTVKDLTLTQSTSSYGGGGPALLNTDPSSCSDVRSNIDNLVSIITTIVGAGSTLNLPAENLGNFTAGGTKCARDLGYLIDAVSTDVFTGGNKYSRDFTKQYFNNGTPISNGLLGEQAESVTAFTAVRDYAKKAITNQLNSKNLGVSAGPLYYGGGGIADVLPSGNPNSCADVQASIDTLVSIVNTVISAGNLNYLNTFSENLGISTTNICARDLGYFVDAISTDVFTGGNSYAIEFTKQYFDGPSSVGINAAEREESVYAFHSARDYAKQAITNQLNFKDTTITADPNPSVGLVSNTNPTSCANVRTTIDTLVGIVTQAIGTGTTTTLYSIPINSGSFLTGINTCRRDIGYIVDAIAQDVKDYTNKNIIFATQSYFDYFGNPIENGLVGEESQTITAFNAVGTYAKKAITNQLNNKDLTLIPDPLTGSNIDPGSCSNVVTFIDNLVGIITTNIKNGDLGSLPSVSAASTVFTVNVGTSTLPHTYVSGGTAFYLDEYFLSNGAVTDALYDNLTGITTITLAVDHNFRVGYAAEIVGLAFTCPSGPGIVTYPSGNRGYIFKVDKVVDDKTFEVNVGTSTLPHTYVSGGLVACPGRAYPSGRYGNLFRVSAVAPGRYLDAYDSILANKKEIQDKSIAAIAIDHPDFYFPNDNQKNERSRYYDAYRLMQKNKQEVIDKSLASIAISYPDFYFPDTQRTNSRSRYYDAYRLIQINKQEIINEAWTNTVAAYPSISSTEEKCKRDLGFFIDAVSTDVFTGGNKYSRDFTKQYFNNGTPISNGLIGEKVESNYAFDQARSLMNDAITNRYVYTDLTITGDPSPGSYPPPYGTPGNTLGNTNRFSCTDVRDNINNLVGIVTTVIGSGSTSFLFTFNENVGISTTLKCARDLGYFIDAISIDVFTGGNKYSRDFTKQYFNGTSPISNGLVGEEQQSVLAFNSAGTYLKKAITNQLNIKDVGISSGPATYNGPGIAITVYPSGNSDSCADVQTNIDNLVGIVTTVIGIGGISFLDTFDENSGTFGVGMSKCYRDVGYIIDAVALDVRDFTNENIIKATRYYYDANGTALLENGILGEAAESITAFKAVRDYSKLAINNQLNVKNFNLIPDPITGSNNDPNSCADVKSNIDNLVGILTSFIVQGNLNNLPSVSSASTVFTVNVGTSTLPHNYISGGIVQTNVIRPFDGEVVFFDTLYYSVTKLRIIEQGSGYVNVPEIVIDPPSTEWGIPAQAVVELNEETGVIESVELVSNGRGYTTLPRVSVVSPDVGITTAKILAEITPTYYYVTKATPVVSGITTVTLTDNLPYPIGIGTNVNFYKQSRVLASGHSLEYIGAGTNITAAIPFNGGVPIQDNETDSKDGGLVVFTTTDQSGNFRIGDGVIVNQATGTISGTFYSKSLFSTITPFILALGGE